MWLSCLDLKPLLKTALTLSRQGFRTEFLTDAGILMMHLSCFAEELILWSTEEFSFIELPDAFTTGSSTALRKKNPDVAELIRGKTGRIYGNMIALMTVMKGLPLAYNRDMQEDKTPVFDTAGHAWTVLAQMIPQIKFMRERMRDAAGKAYSTATDIAGISL